MEFRFAGRALGVLHDLGSHLQEEPTSAELAQDVVEILEAGMGYEFLAVLVVTTPGRGLRPLALSGQQREADFLQADKSYVEKRCADSEAGLTSWTMKHRKSVRVGNVTDDRRYLGIRDDIRSELCVPLVVGSKAIGVLNTETTALDAYTASDQQFLEIAASHIALAILHQRQHVRPQSSLMTSCAYCKSVRVDPEHWMSSEAFLLERFGILLSHGICPTCYQRFLDNDLHD